MKRPLLALASAGLAACASAGAARPAAEPPPDPPARTAWHAEPVVGRGHARNVLVLNHADPSFRADTLAWQLQAQYDWLAEWIGAAPEWVIVHVGESYPNGFAMPGEPHPEMFLEARHVFDSQANWAHEMLHCFHRALAPFPHWFEESMADAAHADSEIALWRRRHAGPFLESYDRVDHRSYELLWLRRKHGDELFPRMYAALRERLDEVRRTLAAGTLEERNRLLIELLSEAAGEDLLPLFREEFGFDLRRRERQRGY